ncbi:cysteine-rich receptor-like protein kinase 25 [Fagus crenata]
MLSVVSLTTHALDDPLDIVCANTTIPKNSPYKSSLSSLLSSFSLYANRNFQLYSLTSSLSSNATSSKIQISVNISDPISGLHLCRGDVIAEVCQACVAAASKELANKCSREMVVVIWYDECMLCYSNASFFSTLATKPKFGLLNMQNITNQERFNRLVNTTMIDLASQSSEVPAGAKKFGTKEVNLPQFQTLYNLVKCTPDLSSTNCNNVSSSRYKASSLVL